MRHSARISAATLAAMAVVVALAGCATGTSRVTDAFPPAGVAAPWRLSAPPWSGSFDDARSSLGVDVDLWQPFEPQHVWIAIYTHEDQVSRRLIVRALRFADDAVARRAYAAACPSGARSLDLADEACWSPLGVVFRADDLVVDIFGDEASWQTEVETPMLATSFVKRLGATPEPSR